MDRVDAHTTCQQSVLPPGNTDHACRYKPCATYTSTLFFCISDLAALDPMYQYSLPWFVSLFLASIAAAPAAPAIPARLTAINDHFSYSLYANVCRSLFERDKLLFSFLLTARVLDGRGALDAAHWSFLLTGGLRDPPNRPANPAPAWLLDRAWRELRRLSRLQAFAGTAPPPQRMCGMRCMFSAPSASPYAAAHLH
jgi:dynein heavy chain, axonemal